MSKSIVDHIIVGGGLAGLIAATILAEARQQVVLIDRSLADAEAKLGGFTRFSGAKFSLLPAGQGLIPIAGSVEKLNEAIASVFSLCEIPFNENEVNCEISRDDSIGSGSFIRSYESIVLTQSEIGRLIETISARVNASATVINAGVLSLQRDGGEWVAIGESGEIARAAAVLCAGGRTSGSLLRDAGAIPQEGKGVDLGVRLEFTDSEALKTLRLRGPDAKILMGATRTFCLNYPGIVYRYPFEEITIPGGIVADLLHPSANVGVLTRVTGKQDTLSAVRSYLRTIPRAAYEKADLVKGRPFQDKASMLRLAYGPSVADQLQAFAEMLGQSGLVDWECPHRIHFPLLDWHWETYGIGASHRTTRPGLFVAGDSAGHARGLLQAGVSGWLAAYEMLNDAGI